MNYFETLTDEAKRGLLKKMYLTRFFEEKVNELFMGGFIHGTAHLSIGQEANAVGAGSALSGSDWMISTHRCHGHFIGRDTCVYNMMAELLAIKDGVCGGLGGSMHMCDIEQKNMASSGIVGADLPLAVGMAFALKYKKEPHIVLAYLGDGASNQGMCFESLNLAAIWEVPVLFYCENNMYAMSAPAEKFIGANSICARAAAFGIHSAQIDGNNIIDVSNAVYEAAQYIRKNQKPYFIEAKTYRWLGHSKSDLRKYRTQQEEQLWKERCPIKSYLDFLTRQKILAPHEAESMQREAQKEIDDTAASCFEKREDILSQNEALSFVYDDVGGAP